MAFVYTLAGDLDFQEECDDFIFCKEVDLEDPTAQLELKIAQMLLEKPQSNVVSIVKVVPENIDCRPAHYDAEVLDINYVDTAPDSAAKKIADIKAALQQLHSLGVIYLDIKSENMGYSHDNNCWKLFDFDCCGLVEKAETCTKWKCEPPSDLRLLKAHKDKLLPGQPLQNLDWIIFDAYCAKGACNKKPKPSRLSAPKPEEQQTKRKKAKAVALADVIKEEDENEEEASVVVEEPPPAADKKKKKVKPPVPVQAAEPVVDEAEKKPRKTKKKKDE
jgi:serine/threonine protein kinase